MADGIVTTNMSEEMAYAHYIHIMNAHIEGSLLTPGHRCTGLELDDKLYPEAERIIIATHIGPLLGKFMVGTPTLSVRHGLKRTSGTGKDILQGERETKLNWFGKGGILSVNPLGMGHDDPIMGSNGTKQGSILYAMSEWFSEVGTSYMDPFAKCGVLDALANGEDYTMLFVKSILLLRAISVGYSVEGTKMDGINTLPEYVVCTKFTKIEQLGCRACTIDFDQLSNVSVLVAIMSASEYPSIQVTLNDELCIYSRIRLPACDVTFVGAPGRTVRKIIPTPQVWWKGLIDLACTLGAVENLVTAFRATRGWVGWLDGVDLLGIGDYAMGIDIQPTKGCKSVFAASNIAKYDRVDRQTNLACCLGELICDWAAGLEMRAMVMHVCDEFGYANRNFNRGATKPDGTSLSDGLMREALFTTYGVDNRFFQEVAHRIDSRKVILGCDSFMQLLRNVGQLMVHCIDPVSEDIHEVLRKYKSPLFTTYYGKMWLENSTYMVGESADIDESTWGALTILPSKTYALRSWLDTYGLSEQVVVLSGVNAAQKAGIELIRQGTMERMKGAVGVYSEWTREVVWVSRYKARVGYEAVELDRLHFKKRYLDMDEDEAAVEAAR